MGHRQQAGLARHTRIPAFGPASVKGLACWYAARFIEGLSDGSALTTWQDASGNGIELTNRSTTYITYKINALNGLPVVNFNSIGTYPDRVVISSTNMVPAASITDGTFCMIAVVYKNGSAADAGGPFGWSNFVTETNQIGGWNGNSSTLYFDFGTSGATGRLSVAQPAGWKDSWQILGWRKDAGNVQKIFSQTTELASASLSAAPSAAADHRIMLNTNNTNSAPGRLNYQIAEVVAYKTAVQPSDFNALIAYYKTLYGI